MRITETMAELKTVCWSAWVLLVMGCGGDDSGPSSCEPPQGAYLFTMKERSGTCNIGTARQTRPLRGGPKGRCLPRFRARADR